jgi:hypothetical protein
VGSPTDFCFAILLISALVMPEGATCRWLVLSHAGFAAYQVPSMMGTGVSNSAQQCFPGGVKLVVMAAADVRIVGVKIDAPDGIIVTFSDGTLGAYVVEELLGLRPHRQLAEEGSAWHDLKPGDRSTCPQVSHPVQVRFANGKTRKGDSMKFFPASGMPDGAQITSWRYIKNKAIR